MFCIGGNDVYQVTGSERAQGGGGAWINHDPDADADHAEAMDQGADEEEEEEEGNSNGEGPGAVMMQEVPDEVIEQLVFPEPNLTHSIVYDSKRGGLWFHFERTRIPHALRTLAPNVFKAMASYEEGTELLSTAILMQPALPMPVHASPLVALFEAQHLDDETPTDMLKREPTWKRKYISWVKSAHQLQTIKTLALNGVFPLHESLKEEHVKGMYGEFCKQLKIMETQQNADLDDLYNNASGASYTHRGVVERFLLLTELYSLMHIHLLEYFLHALLVAPYGVGIPLDAVLTPNDTPSLDDCQRAGVAQEVVRDMRVFFRGKYAVRAAQTDAVDVSQFKPRLELLYDATAPEPGKGDTWRGWLPKEVLIDYLRFMDCDAKLQ